MSSGANPGPLEFDSSGARGRGGGRRRRIAVILVVLALIVSIGALLWFFGGGSGSACNNNVSGVSSQTQTLVVASCNTIVTIAPEEHATYGLPRVSDAMDLWGELSSNATLSAYVLNSSDLRVLDALPPGTPATEFAWASGNESSVTFSNLAIPGSPAQFFFVVQDLHPVAITAVWSDTLVITYTSTFTQ